MRPGVTVAALALGAVVVLGVLGGLSVPAGADGRPPATSGIYVRPGDARTILVRTTFGLLVSRDEGCSFRWVCEQAIGYGGRFDPKYAIAADGTMFATTFTGLRVSRDGGCTWRTATEDRPRGDPGRIAGIWIDAIDLGPDGEVWVATADGGRPNDVYRSTDGGRTFVPRGLRSQTIWWKSVKIAPGDARRVYATGYQVAGPAPAGRGGPDGPAAHLLRSDDRGGRWTPSPLAGVRMGPTPIVYVSAVDPASADTIYVTSLGASAPAGDRLYRSTDGGATLREVLATRAAIGGVVFHGGDVLVATASGAYRSTDGGATFSPQGGGPRLGCLGAHAGGLIGCGANWQPDFAAVARSRTGAGWDKLLRFDELAGPLTCAPGTTVTELCTPRWPGLQQQLGAAGTTRCPVPPPDPPGPPEAPRSGKSAGGCCDAGGAGLPRIAAALLAWLGLAAVHRRRRRRR